MKRKTLGRILQQKVRTKTWRAKWARLYDIGRALYEKGGFTPDDLGDASQLDVEEGNRICERRI